MRWSAIRGACTVVFAVASFAHGSPRLSAQGLEGPGVVSLGLLLRQMDGVKRVLVIGAHPDDEDNSLLATLARGWGAETAYLSLTRGDGGQNLIGPELFEGLGVVRTGELEAARKLDGALQFFTRAFDYGFSKSADEAFAFWPHEQLIGDVVWVIRGFRPQVVVSVWSGTPRDGHGQHQASGIVAREAFAAAGDPTRFPEQLELGVEAWSPAKLYESVRRFGGRGGGPPPGTLRIDTGTLDPLLGRSLYQLAMESRSQHRSQVQGSAQTPGPHSTGASLVESRVDGPAGGLFSGIDTTLIGLAGAPGGGAGASVGASLEAYREALARARKGVGLDPSGIVADLGEALTRLDDVSQSAGRSDPFEFRQALGAKRAVAANAFAAAAGIWFDLRTEDGLVTPGQTVRVQAQLWNGGKLVLTRPEITIDSRLEWVAAQTSVDGLAVDGSVAPGTLVTWSFDVRLPPDAEPSRLYFLREPRDGAWYRWPQDEPELWGLPRDPPAVSGSVSFVPTAAGRGLAPRTSVSSAWRYVGVDPALGEFSKPVLVVPPLSVRVIPKGMVWPQARRDTRSIAVVVHTEAEGGSRGELRVRGPAGWTVSPAHQPFTLPAAGTERTLAFDVRPNSVATPGEHVFEVTAEDQDGRSYSEGYTLIDYEHIERAALYAPSEARITVVPVTVAQGLHVGYVMGSGDDGPEAIRQLGADVELLGEDRVRDGDFGAFDTIVLGIRAYETRPDLRAASEQLNDFARAGGTVIVQYHRTPLEGLLPRPLVVSRSSPRVTDETAPVRILEPNAPVFTTPNQIGPGDFEGWVQERGLYFASEWDPSYRPLLELNDPGENPQRGSLLVTSVGDGVFVYTGLAFFRQWTDRVPGAYRLFANLISMDPGAWRAYTAGR